MAEKRSGTHGYAPTRPSQDEEISPAPDTAGAHGKGQGQAQFDTSSGLSGDKGVHRVGDASMPTGKGPGLEIGESEWSKRSDAEEHTLQGQLKSKGLAPDKGGSSGQSRE